MLILTTAKLLRYHLSLEREGFPDGIGRATQTLGYLTLKANIHKPSG
jgi:hypothetical protein